MTIRSWPKSIVWLVFTLTVAALLAAHISSGGGAELTAGLGLLALYGLQGSIAEFIGLSANASSVSFPRRFLRDLPLLGFWRVTIPARAIARVATLDGANIRFYRKSRQIFDFGLPDRMQRRDFLEFVRDDYPWVDIFREATDTH